MSDIVDRAAHFRRGVDTYARGEHYEAHEVWEELWQDEADDVRRRFLQALIQVASAMHKAANDVAPRGSIRLLDAARQKLDGIDDGYLGIDMPTLLEGLRRCRDEVVRILEAGGPCKIEQTFAPPIRQVAEAAPWVNAVAATVPLAARGAWFDRGLAAYADGDYFEAHELWEELWRDAAKTFDRQFLQGLIQIAAAMFKSIGQTKPSAAARLLERGLQKVRPAPDGHMGLQVKRLVEEGERAKEQLARLAQAPEPAPLPRELVPTIARVPRSIS